MQFMRVVFDLNETENSTNFRHIPKLSKPVNITIPSIFSLVLLVFYN